MGTKRGKAAVVVVLAVAATVGMADLLRSPDQPLRFDKARADDGLDAPIATARYREPTDAQLAAVGLMRVPEAGTKTADIVSLDDPATIPPYDMARLSPPPDPATLGVQPAQDDAPILTAEGPDPQALDAPSRKTRRGVELAANEARAAGQSLSDMSRAMLRRVATSESDRRKSRVFVFAAASEDALGLNLVRDETGDGLRRAGWSVERVARYGEAQIGVGWRKYGGQLSLAAARREIGDARVRVSDLIAGISWSWRPQDT